MPVYMTPQMQTGPRGNATQSRYTSPTQTGTATTTIYPRSSIQLYGSNSTNTSPTSTYQPSQPTKQSPSGSSTNALNPFLAHYAPPKQLHPPKSPLYRPAVLRTTERSSRPSTAYGGAAINGHQSTSSVSSLHSEGKEGGSGLAIFGSTTDMFSNVFGTTNLGAAPEWEEVVSKPITGPPHRRHWKDDAQSPTCDFPICAKNFTLFERRHHCRKCGQIFCAAHASNYIPLDQDCEFHPKGSLSRTCDSCFDKHKRLTDQRRASSASMNRTNSGGSSVPSSPIVNKSNKGADAFGAKTSGSYVGSVPRDWSWSTF
ncbi:hypothetical protein BDZ91DRAFT_318955 [Kalaharituber pfeilii]|nr:hypothetical protein BDZ91DRAFT_318955 [Kalaharituber pfeilii]